MRLIQEETRRKKHLTLFSKPYQSMGKKDARFIIIYLILFFNHRCYYPLKYQLVEIVVMELIKIET